MVTIDFLSIFPNKGKLSRKPQPVEVRFDKNFPFIVIGNISMVDHFCVFMLYEVAKCSNRAFDQRSKHG